MFGFQHWNLEPDMITLAKSLSLRWTLSEISILIAPVNRLQKYAFARLQAAKSNSVTIRSHGTATASVARRSISPASANRAASLCTDL